MIKHSRISWHIDNQARFGGKQRATHKIASGRISKAFREWLPVIVAEIMVLTAFLLWWLRSSDEYHGLALVYAWIIYCLIATALLFFSTWPPEKETDRSR